MFSISQMTKGDSFTLAWRENKGVANFPILAFGDALKNEKRIVEQKLSVFEFTITMKVISEQKVFFYMSIHHIFKK